MPEDVSGVHALVEELWASAGAGQEREQDKEVLREFAETLLAGRASAEQAARVGRLQADLGLGAGQVVAFAWALRLRARAAGAGGETWERAWGEALQVLVQAHEEARLRLQRAREGQGREQARLMEEASEQLGMVAVNAAIEAARLGKQGQAFAVLAREIQEIAERLDRGVRGGQGEPGEVWGEATAGRG